MLMENKIVLSSLMVVEGASMNGLLHQPLE